jgi:hypothetical protein
MDRRIESFLGDLLALRERTGANRRRYSMRPFPSFPITSVPAFALNSFR